MRRLIGIILISFFACGHADNDPGRLEDARNEKSNWQEKNSRIITDPLDTTRNDSALKAIPHKTNPKNRRRKVPINRIMEIGVSDDQYNGKPLLLQIEMTRDILNGNPDTIKQLSKQMYLISENHFPRSIADNFEKGISTEHISYPKLNFIVEVFKDEYADKPYIKFNYSIRKESNGELVVE